jgi:2-polyprenyl-3-methyl-5-hydroxy-6-metoxy-1,4-benzoquinol methylase
MRALLQAFPGFGELRRLIGPIAVGGHLDVDNVEIEVECSVDQLRLMLDGIASAWTTMGEQEPHWPVLTHQRFKQINLPQNLDLFYNSGRDFIKRIFAALRRNGIDPNSVAHAVDYGCGVGRLTLALAEQVPFITGFDISSPHIALARARAQTQNITNVQFQVTCSVEHLRAILPPSDLLISIIVLQHNPPPIIAEVLRTLPASLKPSGVALFSGANVYGRLSL